MKDRNEPTELDRYRLLYQVSNVIHSTLDPQDALELILQEAVKLMGANSGSIILLNPTTGFLEIQAARGLDPKAQQVKLRMGEGITGWVARMGKPARVGDVRKDPRYILFQSKIRSELAVPLSVQGELRGVINVDSVRLNEFSEADEEMLGEFANLASQVIHNTWQYEQLRLKARLFESLVSVSQAISSALNPDEVLNVIAREATNLMHAKMCSILMADESFEMLKLRSSFGAGPQYLAKSDLPVDESLMGTVIRRGKPAQIANVQTDSRYQNVTVARSEGLVSLLSVPLRHGGEIAGTINVYTGVQHSFSNEEIQTLIALSDLSSIVLDKARLHEEIVEAEETLRQNERLSALGLLAAEVAHEIRNPLTVIKMLLHSLNLRFPGEDPRNEDWRIMGEKVDHLNAIVERILSYAKNSEPVLAEVDVNRLLDDLFVLTRQKMKTQNVSLQQCYSDGLPAAIADPRQVEQVFLNLTLNAIEAMPDGGELRVTTRRAAPDEEYGREAVEIGFRDTGPGLSEEQQKNIFSSLLSSSKKGGTGLGLAIIWKIVEAHQGRLLVKSEAGAGAAFCVRLPISKE